MLKPSDIAKQLGCTVHVVRSHIINHRLPAIDIGGGPKGAARYRVSQHDLDAFIASRSTMPETEPEPAGASEPTPPTLDSPTDNTSTMDSQTGTTYI